MHGKHWDAEPHPALQSLYVPKTLRTVSVNYAADAAHVASRCYCYGHEVAWDAGLERNRAVVP